MLTRVLPKALPTSASLHHRQPVSECFSVSIVLRLLQIHFRLWSSNSQVACRKLFKKPTTAGPTVLDRQCWRQLGTKAAKKSKIIKSKLWKVQNSCLGPRLSRFLAFANDKEIQGREFPFRFLLEVPVWNEVILGNSSRSHRMASRKLQRYECISSCCKATEVVWKMLDVLERSSGNGILRQLEDES